MKKLSIKSVQAFNISTFTFTFIHHSAQNSVSTKLLFFHTILLNIAMHYFPSSVPPHYFLSFFRFAASLYISYLTVHKSKINLFLFFCFHLFI